MKYIISSYVWIWSCCFVDIENKTQMLLLWLERILTQYTIDIGIYERQLYNDFKLEVIKSSLARKQNLIWPVKN